jgi:hypothetical protein
MADSCLCDACYRHVDRKANCPSYKPNRKRQHHRSGSSQIKAPCCVQGCSQIAEHHVRRKWLIKLKRSIAKKVCGISMFVFHVGNIDSHPYCAMCSFCLLFFCFGHQQICRPNFRIITAVSVQLCPYIEFTLQDFLSEVKILKLEYTVQQDASIKYTEQIRRYCTTRRSKILRRGQSDMFVFAA